MFAVPAVPGPQDPGHSIMERMKSTTYASKMANRVKDMATFFLSLDTLFPDIHAQHPGLADSVSDFRQLLLSVPILFDVGARMPLDQLLFDAELVANAETLTFPPAFEMSESSDMDTRIEAGDSATSSLLMTQPVQSRQPPPRLATNEVKSVEIDGLPNSSPPVSRRVRTHASSSRGSRQRKSRRGTVAASPLVLTPHALRSASHTPTKWRGY